MVSEPLMWLMVLALPVACVSWTVSHEEVLREPREWLAERSRTCSRWWQRKACYVWTCEYCVSHYVAAGFIALTDYRLLLPDWRGYLLAWLALVAVANVYLSGYSRLRVEINKGREELKQAERQKDAAAAPAPERSATESGKTGAVATGISR